MSDEVKKEPEDKKEEKRDADAQAYICSASCVADGGLSTGGRQFWALRS